MRFEDLIAGVEEAVQRSREDGDFVPVERALLSPETLRTWRGNTGNAKARRRWRRKNIPNQQREADLSRRRLMTIGTHPGGGRIEGIMLVGPDGEEIDQNA